MCSWYSIQMLAALCVVVSTGTQMTVERSAPVINKFSGWEAAVNEQWRATDETIGNNPKGPIQLAICLRKQKDSTSLVTFIMSFGCGGGEVWTSDLTTVITQLIKFSCRQFQAMVIKLGGWMRMRLGEVLGNYCILFQIHFEGTISVINSWRACYHKVIQLHAGLLSLCVQRTSFEVMMTFTSILTFFLDLV